jgi:hypothetical protein
MAKPLHPALSTEVRNFRNVVGDPMTMNQIANLLLEEWADKIEPLERAKAELEALWAYCHIIFHPAADANGALPYPIEHTLAAQKDQRTEIEDALRKLVMEKAKK